MDTPQYFQEDAFLTSIEAAQGEFVAIPALLEKVHVWHDHSEPDQLSGKGYEPTWSIAPLKKLKFAPGESRAETCEKNDRRRECTFAWAAEDLPLARVLA